MPRWLRQPRHDARPSHARPTLAPPGPRRSLGPEIYLPFHTGARFSLKALMPSLASSLMKTLAE